MVIYHQSSNSPRVDTSAISLRSNQVLSLFFFFPFFFAINTNITCTTVHLQTPMLPFEQLHSSPALSLFTGDTTEPPLSTNTADSSKEPTSVQSSFIELKHHFSLTFIKFTQVDQMSFPKVNMFIKYQHDSIFRCSIETNTQFNQKTLKMTLDTKV